MTVPFDTSPVRTVEKNGITVYVFKTANDVALAASQMMAGTINQPKCNLGLATGSTPVKTYTQLIKMHQSRVLSFKNVTTFNLDEYCIPSHHSQSYRTFMQENLFDYVDIKPYDTHVMSGTAVDPEAETRAFESLILARGGVDLWLLGIGANGHIGFNEPGSEELSRSRVVELTARTRKDNARFFETMDQVPTHAVSAGVATILDAKCILLLATGAAKAEAIKAAVVGPRGVECPASFIQGHRHAVFMVDEEAAAFIE
ncbi:Glucosamine-6-phosphate isomerase [Carpediemonas membranifera]|uniref:Glucosamine-6-phosphate isomerase n=1 Tax=Carpediemonas membranifera TaxID=201153 RepID=A0A8J6AQ69_9EUKA|nr:Glucosamine-6-phosphate isomerase [Carpediemonas membranifera]|eukprot:KAG9391066.1 Glucosamine-6-phosphate isomerase [Carpediemonas membranifera]